MRVGVVGHVEWVDFVRVVRLPASGEIVHALEAWSEPAGGGAVVAEQLRKLAGEATLFTALGDDELGHRAFRELLALGLRVDAVFRPEPQRRAVTFIEPGGERTITVIGSRLAPRYSDPLPWADLAEFDVVFFTAGDVAALHAARRARFLAATPRALPVLREAQVGLDVLVGSGRDADERYRPGELQPPPDLAVATEGERGGSYRVAGGATGTFASVPPPGPLRDTYGCGDSFAAGLTYGLASGLPLQEALALGARCGAACLTGRGPYDGQLTLARD